MADKQVIVEIVYDTEAAIENVNKLTDVIVENTNQQAALKKAYKEGTVTQEQYSQGMAELSEQGKKANSERSATIKLLQAEKNTISELQKQNALLRKERDNTNLSTKEGAARIAELNKQIAKNDDAIKSNVSALEKQRLNIGNYKSALEGLPGAAGAASQGFMGMVQAAKAFIATPIGAIVAAIVGVFMLLKKALTSTEEGSNKLNKITGMLSGVFNGLLAVLKPVANFIADYVIVYFETLGKVASKVIGWVSDGLKALGFEGAANAIDNFTKKVSDSAKAAQELADAEAEYNKQQREARKTQLDYQKRAEKLRQLRDDETRSLEQRKKSNKELGALLNEQANAELTIAKQALKVADLRIKAEGESTENLDARAKALTDISDIEERITGQQSEQLANLNSLTKEEKARLEAKQKAEYDALVKKNELEAQSIIDKKAAEDEANAKRIEEAAAEVERKKAIRLKEKEDLKIQHAEELQIALDSMNQILQATQGFADKRVMILSDAFAKIHNISQQDFKSEKDKYIALGEAASGLTSLITANNAEQLKSLEEKYNRDILLAGDNEAAKGAINKKYAKEKAKIQRQQAKEEKAKAMLDILLATAIGVAKSLPNFPLAAIVGGFGAVQLGLVASKPLPEITSDQMFAKGGIIGGNSHAQGGTRFVGSDGSMFEAERGEAMFVLKKDATAEIAALSAINESFGGRSFNRGASHLADGGQVNGIDFESAIRNGFASAPAPVVLVSDISLGLTNMDAVNRVGTI